jgi:hypothetical protein
VGGAAGAVAEPAARRELAERAGTERGAGGATARAGRVVVEGFYASRCGHHRSNGGDVLGFTFPRPSVQASGCGTRATRANDARGTGVHGWS